MRTSNILWANGGPAFSDELLEEVEIRLGYKLPEALVWLLKNVSNGGHPAPPPIFPIVGLIGDDRMHLHGLYGIDAPADYNLENVIKTTPAFSKDSRMIPIGFDPFNGHIFLATGGENEGQIRYLPFEEIPERGFLGDGYFVSDNIQQFISSLSVEEE